MNFFYFFKEKTGTRTISNGKMETAQLSITSLDSSSLSPMNPMESWGIKWPFPTFPWSWWSLYSIRNLKFSCFFFSECFECHERRNAINAKSHWIHSRCFRSREICNTNCAQNALWICQSSAQVRPWCFALWKEMASSYFWSFCWCKMSCYDWDFKK